MDLSEEARRLTCVRRLKTWENRAEIGRERHEDRLRWPIWAQTSRYSLSGQGHQIATMPDQPPGQFEFHQDRPHDARRGLGHPGEVIEAHRGGTEQANDSAAGAGVRFLPG